MTGGPRQNLPDRALLAELPVVEREPACREDPEILRGRHLGHPAISGALEGFVEVRQPLLFRKERKPDDVDGRARSSRPVVERAIRLAKLRDGHTNAHMWIDG